MNALPDVGRMITMWDYQDENTFLYENYIDHTYEENITHKKKFFDEKHYQHFISASLACIISRTITAPLERLKILYQINNKSKPPNIITGLKGVYNRDGFTGLFRGNTISLIKSIHDYGIKFYVFEKTKFFLKDENNELNTTRLFIAGAFGGVVANIAVFPLDVIKTRVSAAPTGTYSGIIDATEKIFKEGGIRVFYKGLQASISNTIPNAGLNLSFYELLKKIFGGTTCPSGKTNLPTTTIMIIGGLSAMFSSTILYPLQTIQSRIIMNGLNTGNNDIVYKNNMIGVIRDTIKNEGYIGFFKGYRPGITKIVLGNSLGFSIYENIKKLFFIKTVSNEQ